MGVQSLPRTRYGVVQHHSDLLRFPAHRGGTTIRASATCWSVRPSSALLWVKPKPGQAQFVFFYQHIWPKLRRGALMSDLVAALAS